MDVDAARGCEMALARRLQSAPLKTAALCSTFRHLRHAFRDEGRPPVGQRRGDGDDIAVDDLSAIQLRQESPLPEEETAIARPFEIEQGDEFPRVMRVFARQWTTQVGVDEA
jgi:hypothetical protein